MKNLRNSLLLQYLTPKHIMTNKKLILKLFAGETRENPSEVEITLEHFFSYCQSIQIEDPEDLLHEMVVNNSIIKCHKIIMESGEEIECICLTEKGLQELKMLFHENRYLKTGEMIEAELKSLLSVIQDSCFSSKKINEYQLIHGEIIKSYYSECWYAIVALCESLLELSGIQHQETKETNHTHFIDHQGNLMEFPASISALKMENLMHVLPGKTPLVEDQIHNLLHNNIENESGRGKRQIPNREQASKIISLTSKAIKQKLIKGMVRSEL